MRTARWFARYVADQVRALACRTERHAQDMYWTYPGPVNR